MSSPNMLRLIAASSTFAIVFAPAFAGSGSGTQAAVPAFGLPAFTSLPLNGSFEYADPFVAVPFGWHNHADVEPTWPLPSPVPPQDGSRIACLNPTAVGARQWSTDRTNAFQWPGSGPIPFFDPQFDWNGGDVEVKVWYNIPASSPITNGAFGIRLDVKGAADINQDNGTRNPWGGAVPLGPLVTGHTNNQWVEYTVIWPIAEIHADVLAKAITNNWTLPPYPDRLKIVLGRYSEAASGAQTGVIYLDNVRFRQIPLIPVGCNLADITEVGGTAEAPGSPDGQLTVDDIIVFVNLFSDGTGCPGAAPCSRADVCGVGGPPEVPEGELTVDDVIAFFNAFADGCAP